MNFAENKTGSSIIIIIIYSGQLNTNQSSQNTQKLILPGQEKILCPYNRRRQADNEVHGCPSLAYKQLSSIDGASVQNIIQEMTVLHPTLFTLVDLES